MHNLNENIIFFDQIKIRDDNGPIYEVIDEEKGVVTPFRNSSVDHLSVAKSESGYHIRLVSKAAVIYQSRNFWEAEQLVEKEIKRIMSEFHEVDRHHAFRFVSEKR